MERVPILKLGDVLLVSIQVDLHDSLALSLQDDLAARIRQTRAKGVLIDISALDVVDSFIGRVFGGIGSMARLLGATTVLVGIRPAVAITLVELGLEMEGVQTALNLEKGLEVLRRARENADGHPAD